MAVTPHAHKCMSCGESWECPIPGDCLAQAKVLPSIILKGPNGPQVFDHVCQRKTAPVSETKERDAARLDFLAEITNLSALLECGAKLSRDQVRKIEKTAQIMVMRYEIYRRDRDTPQAFRSTVDEAMKETGHG